MNFQRIISDESFHCFKDCYKDSCYTFMGSGLTWGYNRGFCEGCGGDLVSIETEEEWNFINRQIRNRRILEWYIGLKKMDGKWTWVSDKPLTISKWRENQPRKNSHVAFIDRDFHAGDQGISTNLLGVAPKAYICEIPKGKTNLRLLSAK